MKKILLTLFPVLCCFALIGQNTITIDMADSYGDGWQGAEISIYEYDGTGCGQGTFLAGPFSIPDEGGSTAQATANLPDGCYMVVVTNDTFNPEVSWTMTDASASVLASGGSNFTGNLNVNGTCSVFGCTDPAATNYNPLATCDDGSCVVCAPGENQLVINMADSFGDGWQGAEISIYEYDGAGCGQGALLAGPFSIPDGGGSSAQESICIADGCYVVVVTNDAFNPEVSWTMEDAAATVLASGGSNFDGNVNINGTCPVDGCTDPAATNYNPLATCDDGSCVVCAPGENQLVINMADSFGDGWQGAEISIYEYDGTGCGQGTFLAGPFSIPDEGGYTAQESICIADGCYVVVVTDDAYNPEVSWTMEDAAATVLASGGSNFDGNVSINGTCPVFGCINPAATNYDPLAVCDDGSCLLCGADAASLPMGAGSTASSGSCEDGTWTYYEAAAGEFIFAVEWDPNAIGGGHNAAAKSAAVVTIQVDASANSASDASSGSFFMGRQWNVDLGTATLDGSVNIKYYYDPTEKSNAEAASSAHAIANGLDDNGFKWFKQTGSADFSGITDPAFQPEVYLTEAGSGMENGVTYVQFDGITSFSSGSGAGGAGGGALPVEFISFTGKANAKSNLLNWATASEINSRYYDVEVSTDGRNFVKIGNVEAAGNSVEVLNYEFVDENPKQVSYYRLKQVDVDGTYEYSNIVNVKRNIEGISISLVRPNPTRGKTSIQFNNSLEGKVNVTLTDVNGQIVSTQSLDTVSGINEVEVDLSQMAVGVYFVSVSNNTTKAVTRVIKAN